MSNQISTQTFSFYGSDLITLKVEDVIYTAVKPIVEAIGLDWGGQQQKLAKSGSKFNCRDISIVAKDGKIREMLCMPIKKLNGWLFSINPEKVRADLKEKVICYQEECFEALYHYWHFGKAERKTSTDERTGLRQAVSALVSKKGIIYSEAYSMIHQRFNVEHIDELTPEQIPMAVEYIHKVYLEGELIIDEPKPKSNHILQNDELVDLAWLWVEARKMAMFIGHIIPALEIVGSSFAPKAHSMKYEYGRHIQGIGKFIYTLTTNADFGHNAFPKRELEKEFNPHKQKVVAVKPTF